MATIDLDVTVDLSGIDQITAGLVARLERVVATYAFKIERTAKQNATVKPKVRTGVLRASIRAVPNGLEAEIGTSVEYAVYQEFGFHHHKTGVFIINPFLRPAVEQHAAAFLQAVADAVNG